MNVNEGELGWGGGFLTGSASWLFSFFSQALRLSGTVKMQKIDICYFCCPALLHPPVTGPQFLSGELPSSTQPSLPLAPARHVT